MKLKAEKREGSQKEFTDVLGNVYGHKKENISVRMNYTDFEKAYKEVGTSSVLVLDVDGEEHEVIVKDIQIDPRKDRIHHVDFYEFTRGEKMEATVSLVFVGEAPAEKLGMVLNTAKTEIDVEAMPKDLPSEIEIDLSVLVDGNSVIRAEDLNLPEGVELVGEKEETIVSVVAAREVGEEDDATAPEFTEDGEKTDDKEEEKQD
jgi:large subunit ribosomal protein L25